MHLGRKSSNCPPYCALVNKWITLTLCKMDFLEIKLKWKTCCRCALNASQLLIWWCSIQDFWSESICNHEQIQSECQVLRTQCHQNLSLLCHNTVQYDVGSTFCIAWGVMDLQCSSETLNTAKKHTNAFIISYEDQLEVN